MDRRAGMTELLGMAGHRNSRIYGDLVQLRALFSLVSRYVRLQQLRHIIWVWREHATQMWGSQRTRPTLRTRSPVVRWETSGRGPNPPSGTFNGNQITIHPGH